MREAILLLSNINEAYNELIDDFEKHCDDDEFIPLKGSPLEKYFIACWNAMDYIDSYLPESETDDMSTDEALLEIIKWKSMVDSDNKNITQAQLEIIKSALEVFGFATSQDVETGKFIINLVSIVKCFFR